MSVGSLMAPDTVEKRGLLRRPKTRKAVDMQAFEGRVEQNLLKSKGFFFVLLLLFWEAGPYVKGLLEAVTETWSAF